MKTKNIYFLLFILSAANLAQAAVGHRFHREIDAFTHPDCAKITCSVSDDFDSKVLTNTGSGKSSPAFYPSLSGIFPDIPFSLVYAGQIYSPTVKKSYLFVTSGTSPPESF